MVETVIAAGNPKTMIKENEDQRNIMKLKPEYKYITFETQIVVNSKLQSIKSFGKCKITFSINACVLIYVHLIYLQTLLLDILSKIYDDNNTQEYYFKLAIM